MLLWQMAADPLLVAATLWPDVVFYDRQIEVIEAVRDCDETVVVAGHQLGKDYVSGFICLWFYLCHPVCRIVTTSVKHDHLRVLWGEIGRFVQNAALPLSATDGGPLVLNHWDLRKVVRGEVCPISYLRGMVSEKGEGLAGHHAPHTLLVIDEASGVEDVAYERGTTWAKRVLAFGNPYPPGPGCTFFRNAVKQGDILAGGGG